MTKAKFKIAQLAAKPIDVELKHPVAGDTGIIVSLCGPRSEQMKSAYEAYAKLDEPTDADNLKLFVSGFVGWDVDAFEMPFSMENALQFFSHPENSWITDQLAALMTDKDKFFRLPEGQSQ